MATFNIKQYSEAGDPWSVAGRGTFQTFFLDIEGYNDATITTNKKAGNTPKLGQVDGDLIDTGKTGKNGQKIYKFKQSFGDQPSSAPVPTPSAQSTQSGSGIPEWFAPYAVMIKQIHEGVGAGNVGNYVGFKSDPEPKAEAPADDTLPGTKLSKSELEDIFGGSMETIDIDE